MNKKGLKKKVSEIYNNIQKNSNQIVERLQNII